jgi:hypothetical protein
MTLVLGYVGAACLLAGGVGWGAQVARRGVTAPMLALSGESRRDRPRIHSIRRARM